MLSDALQQLLVLQDRDARCDHIRKQLASIPLERAGLEKEITEEREKIAAKEAAIREMQVRSQEFEGQVADAEAQIAKYKTQQLSVKKNDEYAALEHEIAVKQQQILEFEDQELTLLEQIDHEKAALDALRAETQASVDVLEARLRTLAEGEANYQGQLDDAAEAVETARGKTESAALQTYDFVKRQVKRAPYIAPIEEGKCSGCHLRVSSDVDSEARRGNSLVRCSSCGRIVYAA